MKKKTMKIRLRTPFNEVKVKPVSWSKVNLGKKLLVSETDEFTQDQIYGYYQDLESKEDISSSTWSNGLISVNTTYPSFEVFERTDTPVEDFLKRKNKISINLYGKSTWKVVNYGEEGNQFNTNNLSMVAKGKHAIISITFKSVHYYCTELQINNEILLHRLEKFESPNLIVKTNGILNGMEENNVQFSFLNNQRKPREVYRKLTID